MTQNTPPIRHPDLEWREDGQPVSRQFDDPYFSKENGLKETRYVFLKHNGLPQRWQNWHGPFCILETGFGTGLNFLASWQAFQQQASEQCWLHFTSIEKFPLSLDQLRQALSLWPELDEFSRFLIESYPEPFTGFHHLSWPEHRVSLTLIFGDVQQQLSEIQGPVHAWYLDGFAPSRNPEMWQAPLFENMRRIACLNPERSGEPERITTVATFTAAGLVRRGLNGAGFRMKKQPGYGRKRDMLSGQYKASTGPELPELFWGKPWLLGNQQPGLPSKDGNQNSNNKFASNSETIAVIGAGLAGCTTARALAERGYQIQVFDPKGIAQGASGNPQGGLYIKLAADAGSTHTAFYLTAMETSLNWIKRTQEQSTTEFWDECGVLQLAYSEAETRRQQQALATGEYPRSILQALNQEEASQLTGVKLPSGGLLMPQAGWVSPASLCKQLMNHPNIQLIQEEVTKLDSIAIANSNTRSEWQLHTDREIQVFSQVVVANAWSAKALLSDYWLPTGKIRGQISYLNSDETELPKTVLCGRSYTAPALNKQRVIGATYNLKDDEEALREADHQENIKHSLDFGDELQNRQITGGRVSFRCTTPDYLPMVGALPDTRSFLTSYQGLARNAKRIPRKACPTASGLWLNVGHGSRGLASAPLCAELLASEISGDSSPIGLTVKEALWPGRFLMRDMIRKKIRLQDLDD